MTAHPAYGPVDEAAPTRAGTLGLALVIALNGVLIIRPEELYPPIDGLRLYYIVIVCALLYHGSAIVRELGRDRLARNPVTASVLGLSAAVMMSHVANFSPGQALEQGQMFAKLVAYYLLVTTAVATLPALQTFLTALVSFTAVQATLALLQYHGHIDVEALRPFMQREFEPDGDVTVFARLCGSGIYNDPNDLCLLLTAGMLICLDRLLARGGVARLLWAGLFGSFGYALSLTQSRGGLLAVAAGFAAYLAGRYGVRRALPLLLLLAPAGLVVFAGRQTRIDLSSEDDTAQHRIRLWSDGFELLPSHPMFGIGSGQYVEECGLVAHNSFVHAYVELGLTGGGLFLAAFLLAARAVWTTKPCPSLSPHEGDVLSRLRPVVFGLVASYMAGMYSLSRNYIPPTYLTLALATVYVRLAAPGGLDWFVVDRRMLVRFAGVTLAGFAVIKTFIIMFARFD